MSLSEWAKNDWLKPHKTSKQEVDGLFGIVARSLQDAKVEDLSIDGRFNAAYRAALTLATILLYTSGYRPGRGQSHHYRTIDAIPLILGDEFRDDAAYLDGCRVKRNASEYDSVNEVSETEADELFDFAKKFEAAVRNWLDERA